MAFSISLERIGAWMEFVSAHMGEVPRKETGHCLSSKFCAQPSHSIRSTGGEVPVSFQHGARTEDRMPESDGQARDNLMSIILVIKISHLS